MEREEITEAINNLCSFFNFNFEELASLETRTLKDLLVFFSSLVIANYIIHDNVPNINEAKDKADNFLKEKGFKFADVSEEELERVIEDKKYAVNKEKQVRYYKDAFNR